MKGLSLVVAAIAFQSAFLFSIATAPTPGKAAASLERTAAAVHAAPAPARAAVEEEPRFVVVEDAIVVRS